MRNFGGFDEWQATCLNTGGGIPDEHALRTGPETDAVFGILMILLFAGEQFQNMMRDLSAS